MSCGTTDSMFGLCQRWWRLVTYPPATTMVDGSGGGSTGRLLEPHWGRGTHMGSPRQPFPVAKAPTPAQPHVPQRAKANPSIHPFEVAFSSRACVGSRKTVLFP